MNIGWWLESATWEHGDKIAVINPDEEKITYNELNALANQTGNVLREKFGINEDDVVCTLLDDNEFHVAVMFATFKVGAVFCPLNRSQLLDKFLYDVSIAKPKLLVTNARFLDVAKELKEKGNIEHLATVYVQDREYPNLRDLADGVSQGLRMTPRSNNDLAIINFTAGTSGPSKGVMLTHGTFGNSVLTSTFWCGVKSSETFFIPLYLFHTAGLNNTMAAIISRATIIYLGGWNPERAIYFLDKYKPDWVYLFVPTMVRDMARYESFKKLDLSNTKFQLAGEPVAAEIHEMLRKQGARTLCGYGMTETMPFVATVCSFYYGDDEIEPLGSVGKPNKEFTRVKLIDPFGEEIKNPNVSGEVLITGDVLTPGYYKDPEKTKENIDEEGWFHSRDLAYMDENGWYYVSGRTDDIILSGGEKVSLIEVDEHLHKSPLVKDVACVGVGHDRFGEVPAAIVVPNEEISEEDLTEMLDKHMREGSLENWKRPRLYIKVDEIPRTMAKRTKNLPALRKMVEGIVLRDEDGVVSMGKVKKHDVK